jgi:hypothetical protein
MHNDKYDALLNGGKRLPPLFPVRDSLDKRYAEWIVENKLSGFKVDAVLAQVGRRFLRVPFNAHLYRSYRKYNSVKV